MVVQSHPSSEDFTELTTCKPNPNPNPDPSAQTVSVIPVINLLDPNAKNLIVEACQEFGFFKLVNHGVPIHLVSQLETLTLDFFKKSPTQKLKVGSPATMGYRNNSIGLNGDVGWIEYLLMKANPEFLSNISALILPKNPEYFRFAAEEYITAVKGMVCKVLELAAEGLGIMEKDELSKLVTDKDSDCILRLNHYPPCPELQALRDNGEQLMGFGEHTDPQIMSAVRSNNTSGLQIALKDGEWVSVPSDHLSFFLVVGDALQVLTNGRFMSVKHRVYSDTMNSRLSMILFGGPPPTLKIAALPSIMKEGEVALYDEFTWAEYKLHLYKTKLADDRLSYYLKA